MDAKEIRAGATPVTGSVVGGRALDVTLLTSSGSQIDTLPAPMEIVVNSPTADVAPASSDGGATWQLLPVLPGRTLHTDQHGGYWLEPPTGRSKTYRVHILTRNLTLFALVQAPAPQ